MERFLKESKIRKGTKKMQQQHQRNSKKSSICIELV